MKAGLVALMMLTGASAVTHAAAVADPDAQVVKNLLDAVSHKNAAAVRALVASDASLAAGDLPGMAFDPDFIAGFQQTCQVQDVKGSKPWPFDNAQSRYVGTVWNCADKGNHVNLNLVFVLKAGKVTSVAVMSNHDFAALNNHG